MCAQSNPPRKLSQSSAAEPLSKLPAGLYLVATPIGNLGDITRRAVEVLQNADLILCEDTRVTRKLSEVFGFNTPLESCHEHNQLGRVPQLLKLLGEGKAVALVSDAGMPLIADPGAPLVKAVQESGFKVQIIPGANAALAALSLSGLSAERFFFIGFLPNKSGERKQELSSLAAIPATLIAYESPSRLAASLADMALVLGPREAAVVREITKLYEEVRRAPLPVLAAHYEKEEARGEIVVVIAPPSAQEEIMDVDALLTEALKDHSARDASAIVAARTGLPKREIYARAISLGRSRS